LKWDQVVEYAFLAEFDILRDAHQDIRTKSWMTPTGRHALDTYFRMCHAQEEIVRLNVKIACLVTYMRDEEVYLSYIEQELSNNDLLVVFQVWQLCI
ncbi:hypothetical protein ARMGADRAFT_876600, partial [Armillaria gallica]